MNACANLLNDAETRRIHASTPWELIDFSKLVEGKILLNSYLRGKDTLSVVLNDHYYLINRLYSMRSGSSIPREYFSLIEKFEDKDKGTYPGSVYISGYISYLDLVGYLYKIYEEESK